jgi:flagellar protein FlaJ
MPLESKQKYVIISTIAGVALIILGVFTGDMGILANLSLIAVFIIVVPFFLYKYMHTVWIKSLETQFPNFVRDIADSTRSGTTLPEAIRLATKADYGKLTPEITSMNNRLSWGTPFVRALEIFGERVKDSKIILEALIITKEAYASGGNVSGTLDAVARDMVMLKEVEAERQSLVKQQVFIMYGIFYMFLGIALMIIFVMVPLITSQPEFEATQGGISLTFTNPCLDNALVFPCGYFDFIGLMFDVPLDAEEAAAQLTGYYIALFFTVVIMQGIFTGLIAGEIGEGSIVSGAKHSLIMVFSAVGIFLFLAKSGFFPI